MLLPLRYYINIIAVAFFVYDISSRDFLSSSFNVTNFTIIYDKCGAICDKVSLLLYY